MGLANKNPTFITDKLIQITTDNEVMVSFYRTEDNCHNVKTDGHGNIDALIFEPSTKKRFYSVTKDEALKWRTSHKALWPVVVEIAYAKFISNEFQDKIKYFSAEDRDKLLSRIDPADLRKIIAGGLAAMTLMHLTGARSKQKIFCISIPQVLANFKARNTHRRY